MIDWQRTEEKLGYGIECLGISKPKVIVNCDKCGKESILTIRIKSKVKNNNISWHCQKCVSNRPDVRKKLSESTKKQHRIGKSKAPELTEEIKEKIRQKSLGFWHSDRSKELKLNYANKYSKLYKGDKRFVESSKKLWKNNEFRGKMVKSMAERGKVSSLALIFYSILSDLNIKYHREYDDKLDDPQCTIGYYTFDCVIPRKNNKDLLVDVNGDWPHSQKKNIVNDRKKSTHIERYLSHLYEYKIIWEHDLACHNKVVETVQHWLDIENIKQTDFNFKDVEIKKSKQKEYKLLLAKYHYLANAGRGGISYGAYLNDELIAVCVFSPLIRQNISLPDGYSKNNARELSRFCIHPKYQKKNFASWFISKCIKKLNSKYKLILSYCDTTFGHDGTIYKACGFKQDRIVKPDYWYLASDTLHPMHKKTLYERAKNLKMTEKQFAESFNYIKIKGKKKLRFIYFK